MIGRAIRVTRKARKGKVQTYRRLILSMVAAHSTRTVEDQVIPSKSGRRKENAVIVVSLATSSANSDALKLIRRKGILPVAIMVEPWGEWGLEITISIYMEEISKQW